MTFLHPDPVGAPGWHHLGPEVASVGGERDAVGLQGRFALQVLLDWLNPVLWAGATTSINRSGGISRRLISAAVRAPRVDAHARPLGRLRGLRDLALQQDR